MTVAVDIDRLDQSVQRLYVVLMKVTRNHLGIAVEVAQDGTRLLIERMTDDGVSQPVRVLDDASPETLDAVSTVLEAIDEVRP